MNAIKSITLPNNVAAGATIDISSDLTAPANAGTYRGNWSFEDGNGKRFGLGSSGNGQIWVQVKVILAPTHTPTLEPVSLQTATPTNEPISTLTVEPTITVPFSAAETKTLAYDFVSEICSAQWFSNSIQLPCPGSSNEAQNTISLVTLPTLEDGSTLNNPAIMISPANGSIQGIYPEYLVQPGDHFRAIASCEANSITCSALFRVSYQDASNAIVDLWAVGEFYDQKYTQIDVDLSAIAGQKVKFILDITPLNTDPGNHAFWALPGIYGEPLPTATPTTAPTATATITPIPTVTPQPSPTAAATPLPKTEPAPLSTFEKIQKFFVDIFKSILGG